MRIGQLARKYTINQDEVILYLNQVQADLSPFHHNSKVSSDIEALVISHFSLSPKVEEEAKEDLIEDLPSTIEEVDDQQPQVTQIDDNEKSETDLQQELDPTLPSIKVPPVDKIDKKDEKSIDTDRLMELLEADESSNNLSEITLIKAPKKELSGLKVVGQIELAEPKSKSVDKIENQDKDPKPTEYNRHRVSKLTKEEKDKRRLKAKEKKEQYEARQEKRRIEGEKKKRKAQNKVRYEEKMQKVKVAQAKQKVQKEEVVSELRDQPQVFKPITIFDKFWKLFNL